MNTAATPGEELNGVDERGIANGVYRPSMVAAYRANPRGAARSGFDAERMSPRWRWISIGAVLVVATMLAGLLFTVPVGPTGAVAGHNGRDLVLAFPNFTPPAQGSPIVLRLGGDRTIAGVVKDSQPGANGFQVTMVLVELRDATAAGSLTDGAQIVLDQGSRPLLLDLLGIGGRE
ncbi:hypothetical protein OG474_29590 [Kribbella sp. NBC_01505]|uniref:hypothetical protein n=1 Tax=Kribbella sp. NBC_01505 TaxID=2903580 RepID=UPI00386BBD62